MSTSTLPKMPKRKQMPQYKVLLHNDDVNAEKDVINRLVEIAKLTEEEASKRTKEAALDGVSLILITHYEFAELLRDRFEACNITVTFEPA